MATSLVVGMVQEELLDDTREDGNKPERDRRKKKEKKRGISGITLLPGFSEPASPPYLRAPEQGAPADCSSKEEERSREMAPESESFGKRLHHAAYT